MADVPTESSITRSILRLLATAPNSWVRKNHGSTFQRRGISDIEFIHKGRVIFFEVKRPGRRPTPI